MWVFLAATLGACALIVVWAIGYAPDVGAVLGLAILGIGILIQMADNAGADTGADR
jgi:hypothetical protein